MRIVSIIAIVLALGLGIAYADSPTPTAEPIPPVWPGQDCGTACVADANCNHVMDMGDVIDILKEASGNPAAPCVEFTDVNCDGFTNGVDALWVLRWLLGMHVNDIGAIGPQFCARVHPSPRTSSDCWWSPMFCEPYQSENPVGGSD